jgi:hypothetical protein
MKFLILLVLSLSTIFAGGDIHPTKVYKKSVAEVYKTQKPKKLAIGYTKPKCEDCGEPAELLPYNGEDLPEAETYPCPLVDKNGCIINIG